MSDDTLRDEILGDDGFANWLRGERLSGKALAEQAQARIQAELGSAVDCANVNDYLCRLLDGRVRDLLGDGARTYRRGSGGVLGCR
jgi:hypothetical protein